MKITIGNSTIPLDPSIGLPLVLSSPLFLTTENKIPGSYIFNAGFPATDALRQEFTQAHRVQKHGRVTAELPYVITSGSLRYSGNCIVTQADLNAYEIAFMINNGDLASKLKNKTLKDLDLGGAISISDVFSYAYTPATHYYWVDDYSAFNFPVNAPCVIGSDINNSMSDSGRCYTSKITGPLHQRIVADVYFNDIYQTGYLQISCFKNGIQYFMQSNLISYEEWEQTLDLVIGDVITIVVEVFSGMLNQIHCAVGDVTTISMEFSTTNMFTQAASMNQDTSSYALFPILNSHFMDNFPDDAFQLDNLSLRTLYTEYFPILNYFKDGKFPMILSGMSEGETFTCGNLFTPFVYMNTLLKLIASDAGYSIINNPFANEFYGAVLFNSYAENTYKTESTTLLPVKPSFDLIDHLPEITQSDFISWVARLTGSAPLVDNNAMTITFVNVRTKHILSPSNSAKPFPGILLANPKVNLVAEYKGVKFEMISPSTDKFVEQMIREIHDKLIYKGEVEDARFLPESGNEVNDMYYARLSNAFFVYQYNPETYTLTWWIYSLRFPLIYKEGEEPYLHITSELAPILTRRVQDESLMATDFRIMYLPVTEQAGTLEGFPDSFSAECGNQVLYYKGMAMDSDGNPYPLGTSRRQDYRDETQPFYPDLNADSLFENQYKEFLRWLAYDTKLVTCNVLLTPGQLHQIKFDQVYSGNGFNFLIKEIRSSLIESGLSISEMDIYTC